MEDLRNKVGVVSFTGGKDCHLALVRAVKAGIDVRGLVAFRPPPKADESEKENDPFKAHPLRCQRMQAKALGLPLFEMVVDAGETGNYALAYSNALRKLKDEQFQDLSLLITGDIDLIGKRTTNFMDDVCDAATDLNLKCWKPLWQQNRSALLQEMVCDCAFEIIFSCVKSPFFDESWIGRRLTNDSLKEIAPHQKDGLDLCGENGEYHTMVLFVPGQYKTRLSLSNVIPFEIQNAPGLQEGIRWWSLDPYCNLVECTVPEQG